MKTVAFQYHKDTPVTTTVATPMPSKGHIQVKVEYSALDTTFDEVLQRTWTGMFVHKLGNTSSPVYLGWHYAGRVTAVGDETDTNLLVGDAVFGHLPHTPNTVAGTLAEYIVVPVEQCAKRPEGVDAKTAAAATVETLTALQALRDHGKLKVSPDEKEQQSVLIVGAGGGVGSAAVQIARLMGAHVTAICSARDVARVRDEYGAHVVLSRDEFADPLSEYNCDHGFDVIFDTPVVLSPLQALSRLTKKGQYVTTLPSWGLLWGIIGSLFSPKGVHMVEVFPRQADLALVAEWMEQGQLKIPIDTTFKVKDAEKALQRQRERKVGRVSVQVEGGWN